MLRSFQLSTSSTSQVWKTPSIQRPKIIATTIHFPLLKIKQANRSLVLLRPQLQTPLVVPPPPKSQKKMMLKRTKLHGFLTNPNLTGPTMMFLQALTPVMRILMSRKSTTRFLEWMMISYSAAQIHKKRKLLATEIDNMRKNWLRKQ